MEALLKKYFWIVKMAGSAAVVAFIASAAVTWAGSTFLFGVDDELAADELAADGAGETDEDEAEVEVARRNPFSMSSALGDRGGPANKTHIAGEITQASIFCPTCAPVANVAASEQGIVRPGEIRSSLPLVLLATMESDDPLYSMATILDAESFALGPYAPNDAVRPSVIIERVERGRVVLRNGRQLEYIELGGVVPPPPAVKPMVTPTEDETAKNSANYIEGSEEAIKCSSENSCTVDRAFVEQLLVNPAALAKQARVVPAIRDGETKGFKFYGIRAGSLPKLLGIKNGDLITSVNGNELNSLDGAMDLYSKLRRASHLSVTLERKGEVVNKEIEIQ